MCTKYKLAFHIQRGNLDFLGKSSHPGTSRTETIVIHSILYYSFLLSINLTVKSDIQDKKSYKCLY